MAEYLIIRPRRFTKVAWLWDADLDEGRACLWRRDYDHLGERLSAWRIDHYEQDTDLPPEAGLLLHATRGNGNDGGVITLAIGSIGDLEHAAPRTVFSSGVMDMKRLSGTRRVPDDDNGANDPDGD